MATKEELLKKQDLLKKNLKAPLSYKWHKVDASLLESAFSRGDFRLSSVLERASGLGCKLDGWSEHFKFDLWLKAFEDSGLDFDSYVHSDFEEEESLPWDAIDLGVNKKFLQNERKKAYEERETETCSPSHCLGCGDFKKLCEEIGEDEKAEEPDTVIKIEERSGETKWYRADFEKTAPLNLLGHLDFVKAFAMAFRRAGISLEYTAGFHPSPKIEVASPLPLGVNGENEPMDFSAVKLVTESALNSLNAALPEGARVLNLKERSPEDLPLSKFLAHQYKIDFGGFDEEEKTRIFDKADEFFALSSYLIKVEKKGGMKETDIRKKVISASVNGAGMELRLLNGGLFKVLEAFVPKEEIYRVKAKRTSLSAL